MSICVSWSTEHGGTRCRNGRECNELGLSPFDDATDEEVNALVDDGILPEYHGRGNSTGDREDRDMEILNYARRCKKKTGHDRHETLHAADNNTTFCGKELNEMWFIESNCGLEPDDVTCKECRRLMRTTLPMTGGER